MSTPAFTASLAAVASVESELGCPDSAWPRYQLRYVVSFYGGIYLLALLPTYLAPSCRSCMR